MSELSPFDHKKSVHYNGNTKDQATRTPFKTMGDNGYRGRMSRSCYSCGIRRVILVTSLVTSHK